MNILILHNIEEASVSRRSTFDYVAAFERYAPEHNYLYHRITMPLTDAIRTICWHAVIFDSTAVGICTFRPRELFIAQKEKWQFLAGHDAVKLVFPQDDPNHGGLMDDWFDKLAVDGLFTVRPEFSDLLYPRTSKRADVVRTLSGFIDDLSLPLLRKFAKPYAERTRLIGQRVTMYPPRGGRQSRIKGEVAEVMKAAAQARGLSIDISTDPRDVLYGDDWLAFLGDCKFVVGAEGGMSLWDPYGELYDQIEAYTAEHPDATFDEIEAACFPGLDGKYVFSGFSPRVLEAAICGCCQILVEGDYLGILKPYEHYIPITRDFSNLDEVFTLMNDEPTVQRVTDAASRALVENPEFRYSRLVTRVMEFIRERLRDRWLPTFSRERFTALRRTHWEELTQAILEQEQRLGFNGAELSERASSLMAAQFIEPLIHPNHQASLATDLFRDLARARADGWEILHGMDIKRRLPGTDLTSVDAIRRIAEEPRLAALIEQSLTRISRPGSPDRTFLGEASDMIKIADDDRRLLRIARYVIQRAAAAARQPEGTRNL